MNYEIYLEKFKNSVNLLDKNIFKEKQIEIKVGIILDSVYLKLYKKKWIDGVEDEEKAKAKIFFSIWVNDKSIKQKKILYNIHALKLRHLNGYSITSREFAENFRKDFKKFQHNWKNVSLNFGPLTLMEGWNELNTANIENNIVTLATNFLTIDHLIDKNLKSFEN